MWYINTMEYHSATRDDVLIQHGWTLKTLHLSERSQSQKMIYSMIPEFIKKKMSGIGKSRQKVYWWWLRAKWSDCWYVWASFGKDESVLESDRFVQLSHCEYTSKHWIIHVKRFKVYKSQCLFFLTEIEKFILTLTRNIKGPQVAKTILKKKNKIWRSHTSWFQNSLRSSSNQNSVILT